jgi:ATP-binding cassette subfamily B protein
MRAKTSTAAAVPLTWKERIKALGNLPRFFRLVWETSPRIMLANMVLRIGRSAIPVAILYVGKLIIDQVVGLAAGPGGAGHLATGGGGLAQGAHGVGGHGGGFLPGLGLGEKFSNFTSIRIMEHAAGLDLDQFEDSTFYDKLERARQQTSGRTVLLSQVLGQVQDLISMAFLAVALMAFNPG